MKYLHALILANGAEVVQEGDALVFLSLCQITHISSIISFR